MKKLLAVLILVLLLAGCHQTDPVNTTPPVTTESIVTTAPTEPATAPTEPVLTEAINTISLKAVCEQMELVALDHRTAAVMEKTFDVANAKMNTVFRILDLYTGEVGLEQTVEGRWNLLPQEDRARLMEYVMTAENYAKRICNINALRKKLDIMADAIRQVFDTTGWETPYWERYF